MSDFGFGFGVGLAAGIILWVVLVSWMIESRGDVTIQKIESTYVARLPGRDRMGLGKTPDEALLALLKQDPGLKVKVEE